MSACEVSLKRASGELLVLSQLKARAGCFRCMCWTAAPGAERVLRDREARVDRPPALVADTLTERLRPWARSFFEESILFVHKVDE